MTRFKAAAILVAIAIVTALVSGAPAQTIIEHPAAWFGDPGRVFFLRLDGSGNRLFVNRTTAAGGEELVDVPAAGGATRVWYAGARREVFDRLAVSGDGKTVAFARGTGSRVYVLSTPASPPVTVADVSPDSDPRQLMLSRDGRWVAFTASGVEGGAPIGRVRVNLYVAATGGSTVYRITSTPLPGKHVRFALSADGGTLVWVDDPAKGPIVGKRDGSGAARLPAPGGGIDRVYCAADGSRVYCTTGGAGRVRLHSIARAGSRWTLEDEAPSGWFFVAPESGAMRLIEPPGPSSPGRCSAVNGKSSRTAMFTFQVPRHAGSLAFSGDGQAVVWREGRKTRVWKAGP